jgi:cyanophycinase
LLFCLSLLSNDAFSQDSKETNWPSLVIAGGGLDAKTAPVWQAFIKMAKGDGPIIVIPAASGSPADSAMSVKNTFEMYQISPDKIKIARLALKDDPSTEDIDEQKWKKNANDPDTVELIRSASAVWFTGGDQSRITKVLLAKDGGETLALRALRELATKQIPIGGTSAGAAIMSDPMIKKGDSLTALVASQEGEYLEIGTGLGFFNPGIVDQHFGQRARLGRLIKAISLQSNEQKRIGYGIDENTAFILTPSKSARIEGEGYVTVIDGRTARFEVLPSGQLKVSGVRLHLLSEGDEIDLETLELRPAQWKKPTVGQEYVREALPGGGGMALMGQELQTVLGEGLIDNEASSEIERISFDGLGNGTGFLFSQSRESSGYWGRGPDGQGKYTITNIRFDIVPLKLSLDTLK